MYSLEKLAGIIEEYAPISLSDKMVELGGYDNSGVIVNSHSQINGVLFTLDLSMKAVERAKRLGCDTIVTHHPAIYHPISNLSVDDQSTAALLKALENKFNIISVHLNLDVADNGVDHYLAEGLGGKDVKVLGLVDQTHGYGREFAISQTTLGEFVKSAKKTFKTDKVIVYGSRKTPINKVASFCGAGSSDCLSHVKSGKTDADLIVTSDMPHHVIKELVDLGKCVLLLTHYAAENYGFKKFCQAIADKIGNLAKVCFFEDIRLL